MKEYSVGVLGGMGSYATSHFFKKMIDAFPGEKEWDRPRIIIDNRCTMPSRVRAILHGEKQDELLEAMEESIRAFVEVYDVSAIVLACNTSHFFYEELEKRIPGLDTRGFHLIRCCRDKLVELGISHVGLIASEGTIESKIFEKILNEAGIDIAVPDEDAFPPIRSVIEDVKQDRISPRTLDELQHIIDVLGTEDIILGCTELPILYDMFKEDIEVCVKGNIIDPMQCAIDRIVVDYNEEKP